MKRMTAAIVLAWTAIVAAAGAWTLASVSEDGREMMVMVDNLSGDVREGLAFAVAEEWRGAAVLRLGPDGREESPETVSARWTPKCAFAQMQPEFFVFAKCDKIHTCEF